MLKIQAIQINTFSSTNFEKFVKGVEIVRGNTVCYFKILVSVKILILLKVQVNISKDLKINRSQGIIWKPIFHNKMLPFL